MKQGSFFILFLIVLISCTKEIDLDLKTSEPQYVIEGNISDQVGPYYVRISKSVNFDQPNVFPAVSDALVIVKDDHGNVDTLSEVEPGLYQTSLISGIPGYTYTLNVFYEGKSFMATSTMPNKVSLDSIQFESTDNPGADGEGHAIVPLYTDPTEYGNSYRFFFQSNGVVDSKYHVSNDNIGNGNLNQQPFFTEDVDFLLGDTAIITMQCIDVYAYQYFYTLSQIGGGGPIGGSTPTNPPSNIIGENVLGLFSAHTSQTLKTIVK